MNKKKQVLDYAMLVPGSSFRAEIWMQRFGCRDVESPCPTAMQPFCARSLAFPFRPLGLNGGEEDSDSLDTSSEHALAQPGKPRCERPCESGPDIIDNGAAEAST